MNIFRFLSFRNILQQSTLDRRFSTKKDGNRTVDYLSIGAISVREYYDETHRYPSAKL
jgi:hypothetical protein